jgi:hypothetical protein
MGFSPIAQSSISFAFIESKSGIQVFEAPFRELNGFEDSSG